MARAASPVDTAGYFRTSSHGTTAAASCSYSGDLVMQLPQVEFNFEDLRRRMAEFTTKFDAFIENGRKQVLRERNEFRARLGELHGRSYNRQAR